MILLILGLALWSGAHLYRSISPEGRARLTEQMGSASKGVFAVAILLSVVLMVIGYRSADFIPVWTPPAFFGHINNLLMLFAFYIFFQTATKEDFFVYVRKFLLACRNTVRDRESAKARQVGSILQLPEGERARDVATQTLLARLEARYSFDLSHLTLKFLGDVPADEIDVFSAVSGKCH